MSHETDLQELTTEEADLLAKIESLREKRKEIQEAQASVVADEKAEKDRNKEIVVNVVKVSGGVLVIDSLFRKDVLEIWKSTPGRSYKGYQGYGSNDELPGRNTIPVGEWPKVKNRLDFLNNIVIDWDPEAQKQYDWLLNAPPWEIDVDERKTGKFSFICKQGPNQNRYDIGLGSVPGASWDYNEEAYLIPLSEGWRIPEGLEKVEGVIYSPSASALIFDQVKNRAELDLVAKKEDSDYFTHLNGNALRGFQKVAIEFIDKCGGRMILADPTGVGKTWEMLGFAESERLKDPDYRTLCVVKAANMKNWEREIIRLTGTSPAMFYTTTV
ncbi:MAG: hypothetical protein IIC79_00025 [Chloroflexi bacterium]|nr:hypothetical protein [Chloroflexota bacterium]